MKSDKPAEQEAKCRCGHDQTAHILDKGGYWCSVSWLSDTPAGFRSKYMCPCDQFEPTPEPSVAATPELCDVCRKPVTFPADDDPRFVGDTAVTSECRHMILVREPSTAEAHEAVLEPGWLQRTAKRVRAKVTREQQLENIVRKHLALYPQRQQVGEKQPAQHWRGNERSIRAIR